MSFGVSIVGVSSADAEAAAPPDVDAFVSLSSFRLLDLLLFERRSSCSSRSSSSSVDRSILRVWRSFERSSSSSSFDRLSSSSEFVLLSYF